MTKHSACLALRYFFWVRSHEF